MPSRIKCPQCEATFAYSPALLGKTVRCRSCQHTFTITAPPPEDPAPAPAAPSQPAAAKPAPAAPTPAKPAPNAPAPGPASKSGPPPLPPRPAADKASKSGETKSPTATKGSKSGEARSPVADKGSKPGGARRKGSDEDEDEDDRPPVGDEDDRDDEDEDDRPSRRKGGRSRYAPAPEHESNPMLLIGLIAAFILGFLIIACGIGYLLWPSPTPPSSELPPGAPANPMAAADPPKNLDEIIPPAPDGGGEVAGPPPARPKFDPPRFDPPDGGAGPGPGPARPPVVVRPPRAPGGPAAKPRPLLAAPKFAPVEPLPIEPTPLATTRVERALPGAAENLVVAGGGRLLLLHLPRDRRVAVFDVSKGDRVKLIPADDPRAMVAGGMNLFVIYLPGKNVLERWNTKTLDREAELKAEFPDDVRALAMGSASNGPLVAAVGGSRKTTLGGATLAYFDPGTGKEIDYEVGGGRNAFGLGLHRPAELVLRVSADGSVVSGFGGGPGPQVDVIQGGRIIRHAHHIGPDLALPGPDGRTLYGNGERFPADRPTGGPGRGNPFNPEWLLPAAHGDYFVSLRAAAEKVNPFQPRKAVAEVCAEPDGKPVLGLGELPDFEVPGRPHESRGKTFDQNVVLVPDAKVMAVVPTKRPDRLVLLRADLDAALVKAGGDYLFVTSRPPAVAFRGETYKHTLTARSKKGGVKVTLDRGPAGMSVTPAGAVTWDVPKDFADPEAGVTLKVTDAGGKELLQSFRVSVRSRDEKAAGPKGK